MNEKQIGIILEILKEWEKECNVNILTYKIEIKGMIEVRIMTNQLSELLGRDKYYHLKYSKILQDKLGFTILLVYDESDGFIVNNDTQIINGSNLIKEAYWKRYNDYSKCSNCGCYAGNVETNYCHNCGCKMLKK